MDDQPTQVSIEIQIYGISDQSYLGAAIVSKQNFAFAIMPNRFLWMDSPSDFLKRVVERELLPRWNPFRSKYDHLNEAMKFTQGVMDPELLGLVMNFLSRRLKLQIADEFNCKGTIKQAHDLDEAEAALTDYVERTHR